MDALEFHAALGDHVARNRRIDAAREQHRRPTARAGGQTASAGRSRSVDISGVVTHLDVYNIVRIVNVNGNVRKRLCEPSADLLRNLDRVQRELFVRTLGLDLETAAD